MRPKIQCDEESEKFDKIFRTKLDLATPTKLGLPRPSARQPSCMRPAALTHTATGLGLFWFTEELINFSSHQILDICMEY